LQWRERAVLFTAAFALTPIVVFNQQIITGRSLQPLHYELYIAKYLALLALILAIVLIWRGRAKSEFPRLPRRALLYTALIALAWGAIETAVETHRHAWASLDRDEAQAVAKRLAKLTADSHGRLDTRSMVLYVNLDHADFSPVVAPQPVLWSPHVPAFSGVTLEENRERIYQYLYYTGEDMKIDERQFEALAHRKKYLIHSLIEWGHNDPAWTVNWKQITTEDVREALGSYATYANGFGRAQAANPALSYVVAETQAPPEFSNLDRWYEREETERVGKFPSYRVKLKP
jgi:hypothetical protein